MRATRDANRSSMVVLLGLVVACASRAAPSPGMSTSPAAGPIADEERVPPTVPTGVVGDADAPPMTARIQLQHGTSLEHASASPTGLLALYGSGSAIQLWDVTGGSLVSVIATDLSKVQAVRWTAAGDRLVATGDVASARVSRVLDLGGRRVEELPARAYDYVPVPDGGDARWIALRRASLVESELVWIDGDGGQRALRLPPTRRTGGLYGWASSADGSTVIAVRAEGGELVVWSTARPDAVGTAIALDESEWRSIEVSHDGEAATLVSDFRVTVVDLRRHRSRVVSRDGESVSWARVEDGTLLVRTRDALVASTLAGRERWRQPLSGGGDRSVDYIPSTRSVVALADDHVLRTLDLDTGRPTAELGTDVVRPAALSFTSDAKLVVQAPGRLTVWSLTDGRAIVAGHMPGLVAAGAVGDGLITAVAERCDPAGGSSRLIVQRWSDLAGVPSEERRLDCGTDTSLPVLARIDPALARAPQGSPRSFTAFPPSVRALYERLGPEYVAPGFPMLWHEELRLSFDGARIYGTAAPSDDMSDDPRHFDAKCGHAVVWDRESGALVHRSARCATSAVLAGDGRALAYSGGTLRNEVFVEEIGSGRALATIQLAPEVSTMAPTVRGFMLAQADGTVRLYEGANEILSMQPAGEPMRALWASPDGTRIAGVGNDNLVRLWDASTGALLVTLAEFVDDETVAFTPAGAYQGTTDVATRISWAFAPPPEAFSFEQFAATFARGDVVTHRLTGARVDLAARPSRPPRVTITSAPTAPVATATAELRVRVDGDRVATVATFVEGRMIERRPAAAGAELALTIPVRDGVNRVAVVAFAGDGAASNAAVVDVVGTDRSDAPDLWIVAIGVSHYPRLAAEWQLDVADDDAVAMVAALERLAGPGKVFASSRRTLLRDAEVTPDSVHRALAGLSAMGPRDVAFVFLAGHGLDAGDGMVFVTSTAELTESSLRSESVGWDRLAADLAGARGRVVMLLDACHAGAVTRELVVPNNALADALAGDGRSGVIVFAASKGRQLSYEPAGARMIGMRDSDERMVTVPSGAHGVFTGALLSTLDAPDTADRNGDRTLQLSELMTEVRRRVETATGGLQTPWVARRELFGDFALLRYRGGAATRPR